MAAFSPYRGAYLFGGQNYAWRCYATTRVYDARLRDHTPSDPPPAGRRWLSSGRRPAETGIVWLVDAEVLDFSHILSSVEATGGPVPPPSNQRRRRAVAAAPSLTEMLT
jgi:hypothetical protein